MMEYLKIRNWDKWQSYRADRGQPPWIKIHRCVMRNPEWVSLTDAERGQLVAIWLLAADHDGVIPASPDLVQKLCFMEKKPNFNKFIELSFICQDGANVTSTRRQHDRPEESREDKNKDIVDSDESTCDEFYLTYKKRKLSGKRLESFKRFWEAFDYKDGKAKAADSWYDIPKLTETFVDEIVSAAKAEAGRRPGMISNGKTPKMAQGWITERRWEDETYKKPLEASYPIHEVTSIEEIEELTRRRG